MSGIVAHLLCLAIIGEIALIRVSASAPNNATYMTNAPDLDIPTPYMIQRAGYKAESHYVVTEDGYMLTMHRIPGRPGSSPVLLQHGLLGSSADWVMAGKDKGLAYILSDLGYDVWLGNFRGNTYSRAHVSLSIKDSKYWNFTWHEMGVHDLPAMITYIVNMKNCKLMYVGHSMGTTTFYVMDILRPEVAKSVSAMFSLAPEAYTGRVKSPIRLLAPFVDDIEFVAHFLGQDEFLPQTSLVKFLAKYGCDSESVGEEVCANILFVICGFDREQFNEALLPVILTHTPAGVSTKTVVHYGQEVMSSKFRQYDYGPMKNKQVYNSTKPPEYDIKKLSTPIAIYYAENDWLANIRDVNKFVKQIPHVFSMYKVPYPKFNHLDFLWANDVVKYVYKDLTSRMEKFRDAQGECVSSRSENDV